MHYDKPIQNLVRDYLSERAVGSGDIIRKADVAEWFVKRYPLVNPVSVTASLTMLSTNAPSRVHYHGSDRPENDVLFKLSGDTYRLFEPSTDPEPIRPKAKQAAVGVDELVELASEIHPGWEGFDDQTFIDAEITYKQNLVRLAQEKLSQIDLARLISAGDYDEVIKRALSVANNQHNNFLFKGVPRTGDLNILHSEKLDRPAFVRAFFDLLYGEGDSPSRLGRYVSFVTASGLPSRWTFPTMYLFLLFPEIDLFVKPTIVSSFMRLIGRGTEWTNAPSEEGYRAVLEVGAMIRSMFPDDPPSDMVDVHSFIWVVVRGKQLRERQSARVANAIKTYVKDEIVQERQAGELAARALLEQHAGAMTEELARDFFRELSRDLYKGKQSTNRFFPALVGANVNQMVGGLDALNRWILTFWTVPDDQLDAQLDAFWKSGDVPGGGRSLPTAILYLRDPERYRIMMPAIGRGLQEVSFYRMSPKPTAADYRWFNADANALRQRFNLPPQAVDLVLSYIAFETVEPEGRQYWWMNCDPAEWDPDDLEVGGTHAVTANAPAGSKRGQSVSAENLKEGDAILLYELSPSNHVSALAHVVSPLSEFGSFGQFELTKDAVASNRVSREELSQMPELAESDAIRRRDGVLHKITKEEFDAICSTARFDSGVDDEDDVVEKAMEGLFMTREQFDRIIELLMSKQNVILQGPPGVGKTFVARRIAHALMAEKADDRVEVVQFHQSYSYEDFIQGFRPREGESGFALVNGVFHRFCEKARRDPGHRFVFVIDEINRGNLSKIFGELMMLIESDKRGIDHAMPLTYSPQERFYVPENVYILGMMNTADRSLAMVDYALRRRFAFVDLEPTFNDRFEAYMLERMKAPESIVKQIVERLEKVNHEIANDRKNLGKGFRIGHSYFCNPNSGVVNEVWYERIVKFEIEPLLREYWFDNEERAETFVKELLA